MKVFPKDSDLESNALFRNKAFMLNYINNYCKPILKSVIKNDFDISETIIDEVGFVDEKKSAYKFDIVFLIDDNETVFSLAKKLCAINVQLERLNLI